MPAPGGQNSMPYFLAADSRKSKTSLLPLMLAMRSASAPCSPTIIWSQWILAGTAVEESPQDMNCSKAIWAEASCIATRSGLSLRFARPRTEAPLSVLVRRDSSAESRWEYKIFSASVRARLAPKTFRTSARFFKSLGYGGVLADTVGASWVVAKVRRCRKTCRVSYEKMLVLSSRDRMDQIPWQSDTRSTCSIGTSCLQSTVSVVKRTTSKFGVHEIRESSLVQSDIGFKSNSRGFFKVHF